MDLVRHDKIQLTSIKSHELNLMNVDEEGFFDDLEKYIYLSSELVAYLTTQDLQELEQFDKKNEKLLKNWTLYFDKDRNIIAQKQETLTENTTSEKDFINVESTATSKPQFEVAYPESTMRTMDYDQGYPPRREVSSYISRMYNLDLMEVQSDTSDVSSIYSMISVEDVEETPSSSDYSFINSFIYKPYGMAEKYEFYQNMFQHDLDNVEEQFELLQYSDLNLMYN